HGILADVATGLQGDFPPRPACHPVPVPPTGIGRNSIGVDTTFATADYPAGDLTYVITKATAAAIVLAAPSKAQNGLRLTFRSATAAAHTITYAAGVYGDAGASDIATFAALVGASATFEANAGTWGVIALANVTAAEGGDMDADLGLSHRDKELKKWNAPYVYREFPRMLYRGTVIGGRVEVEQRIVGSEGELGLATATGWDPHPQRALEAGGTRPAALGVGGRARARRE